MATKKVIDRRSIKLENVLKSDYIPFLGGRPERSQVITLEDITNLTIALNTSNSIDDLIKKV